MKVVLLVNAVIVTKQQIPLAVEKFNYISKISYQSLDDTESEFMAK